MSSQVNSFDLTPFYIQTGYGIPDHYSTLGSEYTDLYTAFKYVNKNGLDYWVQMIDATYPFSGGSGTTFTGGTVTGATNFTNGLTANTISATTYLNLPSGSPITVVNTSNLFSTGLVGTGDNASGVTQSNFFGPYAGWSATSASNSNFIGRNAGSGATSASFSNFLGINAGNGATSANNANFIGQGAGRDAKNAMNSNFFGTNAGQGATGATGSNFFGNLAGQYAINANNSNFLGREAGYNATGANLSNFIGFNAGRDATDASVANFLGNNAGYQATNAIYSNFFGGSAGRNATDANNANFFGQFAGFGATGASNSNFFGTSAGEDATNAIGSNFFGNLAGSGATGANNSNFFGREAGNQATDASYSNLFGFNVGDAVGLGSIGSNNIIIGTNISLASGSTNRINLGGVLFGTGTYSTTTGNPSIVAQSTGRIGINVVSPATNLHVVGNTIITGRLSATTISATTYLNLPFDGSPISVVNSSNLFSTGLVGTGINASGVTNSNFFGQYAGNLATGANQSNFFGYYAGLQASGANNSNFIGRDAGNQATNANNSNFMGFEAGVLAINARNSNFFGEQAGKYSTGASYSNLFGYRAGYASATSLTIGSNNIIIGTNISLSAGTTNSINLGGVLFGTGAYSTTAGTPSIIARATGRIGINVVSPTQALHVSGNTLINGSLTANTLSATSINRIDFAIFNTGTTSASTVPGTVYFDNTEKALSYNTSINQGVTVNLGQQSYLRVFNNSGLDIAKGKGIELLGSYSGLPAIQLAVNRHYNDKDVVGVSAEIIPNNSEGIILTYGIISNITVTGASIGSLVYASDTTPGEFKNSTEFINFPLTARTNAIGYIIQTGTTTGKLFVNPVNENNNLSLTDLQRNILEGNVISTGVFNFSFSGISLASSNTFNVGPAEGWIVDNTTNPLLPDVLYVKYTGQTNIPSLYYSSATQTYLLLTSAATLTQQVTYPTPQQRRQGIYLGKMGHGNRTSLINAFSEPDFEISPISQIRDMFTPIKLINENVYPSPNSNLTFNNSSGTLWGLGIGFATNQLNPSSITVSGNSPTTFQYRTQTGGTATNRTTIIPGSYDLNGVITTIGSPAKQATNQRIFLLQNGLFRIQYGQTVYADLTAAIAAVNTEAFTTFSNFRDNAVLIAILSVRSDATILTDTLQAKITFASKFGESVGGTGGISTTNLQQAYNNSTTPEIVINSTLDGLSIENGTGNADNVTRLLEGLNAAGNATSFIRADGNISGTTIQTNGFTANTTGLSATTISATTIIANNISGTTNYVSKFTGANSLGSSLIYDNGTNVGIGTISPSEKLHVAGNIKITGDYSALNSSNLGGADSAAYLIGTRSGWYQSLSIKGGTTVATNKTLLLGQYDNGNALIFNQSPAAIIFSTDATEKMRITSGGTVGIGTTAPTTPLHVNGIIQVQSTTGNTFYGVDVSGSYARTFGVESYGFRDIAGNTKVSINTATGRINTTGDITAGGNLGVGTTTPPEQRLGVVLSGVDSKTNGLQFVVPESAVGSARIGIVSNTAGNNRQQAYIKFSKTNTSAGRQGSIGFFTAGIDGDDNTEQMRIDSNGNVGIGTTSPITKLHVAGGTLINGGLTANTISATTYSGSIYSSIGTYGTVSVNAGNLQGIVNISGSNTIGGSGYTDFIKVTNTAVGATNPNKTIRVNNTGAIEFINSAYLATTFSISDNGIITITSPASVTSNSATSNALNIGTKGQLFDDGNFHIHSSSGAVWINALDGSAIRLGTQTNTGNSAVIVDTTTVGHSFFTKVQSAFNVAFGTEITMDNLKVRINGTGGSGGLVQAGAVSSSFAAYTTLVGNVAGAAIQGDTNSGGITFTTTYQNISGAQKTLSAGGDTTTLHLIDTTNSRIYRITAIHCQGTTGGYTSIERMS